LPPLLKAFAAMKVSTPTVQGSYLALTGSGAVTRGLMAGSVPRLAPYRASAPRAVARALSSTAVGRLPEDERRWIERVEERRSVLASRREETRADYADDPEGLPEWAKPFENPIPTWGATGMLSIPPLWGRCLHRLVSELEPRSCLELGTAFGISTAFQASALELNGGGRIVTLDAAREWAQIAEEGWESLGLADRIDMRVGQISETLPAALEAAAPIEFVFVDAEHQAEPTLAYFEAMLPHLASDAVVVFDDIGFPRQMRGAWKSIKRHSGVGAAVGLGRMGVVTVP